MLNASMEGLRNSSHRSFSGFACCCGLFFKVLFQLKASCTDQDAALKGVEPLPLRKGICTAYALRRCEACPHSPVCKLEAKTTPYRAHTPQIPYPFCEALISWSSQLVGSCWFRLGPCQSQFPQRFEVLNSFNLAPACRISFTFPWTREVDPVVALPLST